MELKIYNPRDGGFAQTIQWNFTELKTEIAEVVHDYEVSVYTDDTIKLAKADRAKLNKFVAAIENKRKEIKRQYLDPYQKFETEEKELISILDKAIQNIDSQIKGFEERQREEKRAKILEFYEENIHDLGNILPFSRVFRPEYSNASTTMKSIKEDILSLIQKVDEGLAILNEVDSKFAGDMKEEFLQSYDIGAALAKRNQLEAEEQKRKEYEAERSRLKQEKEARQKEETERVMAAGRPETDEIQKALPPVSCKDMASAEDPVHILDFRVHATASQLAGLKQYLKDNGIRFEPVSKR